MSIQKQMVKRWQQTSETTQCKITEEHFKEAKHMFVISSERLNWKPSMVSTPFKGYLILKSPLLPISKIDISQQSFQRSIISPACHEKGENVFELIHPSADGNFCKEHLWLVLSRKERAVSQITGAVAQQGLGTTELLPRAAWQSQSCKSWAKMPWRDNWIAQKDFTSVLVAGRGRNLRRCLRWCRRI